MSKINIRRNKNQEGTFSNKTEGTHQMERILRRCTNDACPPCNNFLLLYRKIEQRLCRIHDEKLHPAGTCCQACIRLSGTMAKLPQSPLALLTPWSCLLQYSRSED